MKSLFFNSQLFVYSSFFVMLLNISGEKALVTDLKAPMSISKNQGCQNFLTSWNNYLFSDPDGILDPAAVKDYADCVTSLRDEWDRTYGENWENTVSMEMLMLECYINLMDYYDTAGDDDSAEYYEGEIDEITGDD